MNTRTVSVELLRAGPPHNQLLSPLTRYLGIYGESEAGVVTLPWEQYKFDRRLPELRYEGGSEEDVARRLELLRDTGAEIAGILGQIPGLAGDLRTETGDETLTHLRLVISASELALLPWELTRVPKGARIPPDDWLLLQRHAPICLTRHIRSVPTTSVRWPVRPRLLVITGDPGELSPALEGHFDALYHALESWLDRPVAGAERRPWPEDMTRLENATVQEVEEACGRAVQEGEPYTHVHVLAHGAEDESTATVSFGLLLRDPDGLDPSDAEVVSGDRFARALTAAGGCPAVVTLASCDSANQGEVVAPGSSFAHVLHQAGIPLVVASQFPLSMDASVALVERLYSGLLWGEDPLGLLYRIRTELHSRFTPRSHDWASLVVYEALPEDLDDQLEDVVYGQSKRALEAALKEFEQTVDEGGDPGEEALTTLAKRVEHARGRLPRDGPYALEALGLGAASRKRLAEVEFRLAGLGKADPAAAHQHLERCHELLARAGEDYRQAATEYLLSTGDTVHRKATLHWVLVQALALATLLGEDLDGLAEERWRTGRLSAEVYLDHDDREERAWAHGSLAELWLLRLAGVEEAERAEVAARACDHAAQILRLYPRRGAFPVDSTRRQFARYVDWWGSPAFERYLQEVGVSRSGWEGEHGIVATAGEIVARLGRGSRRPSPRTAPPPSPPPTGAKPRRSTARRRRPPPSRPRRGPSRAPGGSARRPRASPAGRSSTSRCFRPTTETACGSNTATPPIRPGC